MPSKSSLLRVAACQVLTSSDVADSTRKIVDWLGRAKEQKVQLVTFPEGALHGYTPGRTFWRTVKPRVFQQAEQKVAQACRRYRLAAVIGSAHVEGGAWMNSLAILDPKGNLTGRYSKSFLAGEQWFASGRNIVIHQILGVPCCFLICHDIRYPELVRLPAVRGARMCIYCSCESGLVLEHKLSAYRAMPISRAAENGIWLVMANTPADPTRMNAAGQSHGNSKIIDPAGNVLEEAGHFEQRLVIADIDPDQADRWIARRVYEEPSLIQEWIRSGAEIVQVPGSDGSRAAGKRSFATGRRTR